MELPACTSSPRRLSPALFFAFTISAAVLSGCQRAPAPAPAPTVDNTPLQSDLEAAQAKIGELNNLVVAKDTELKTAGAAVESGKTALAEKDVLLTKKDKQLQALQAEMDAFKKRDAFVFSEISDLQQQGQTAAAITRYQQFAKDFPKSPLAPTAISAISDLSLTAEAETRPRSAAADPKSRQREFLEQFDDGFLSLQELAPVVKKKTVAQILALLGPPNRVYGDGTEIGYVDKAIDPVTGKRGIFIIAFEFDTVANIRVEYAGRRMVP